MSPHISTLDLNRYRYGELDREQHAAVDAHVEACARCARRLSTQQANRVEFVARPVPQAIANADHTPAPAAANNTRHLSRVLSMVLMAAAAALLWVAVPSAPLAGSSGDTILLRGDLPDLELWLESDRGPRPLRAGERLHSGDTVQMLFRPRGARWITLVGRDGTDAIEVWGTTEPMGNHLQPAPFALTLDDSPGPQQFFLLASDGPLDRATIREAVEGEAPGVRLTHLTVEKD